MLTISTSPGCRIARWGWQLSSQIRSHGQDPRHDLFEGWRTLGIEGAQEEKVLPHVVGLLGGQDEDEETGSLCLQRTATAVQRRHDA